MFLSSLCAIAQTEFITTWKTDNPGTSNSTSITIPTFSGETYSYDVDWNNDGNYDLIDTGLTGDVTHDFGTPGTYTIRIRGTFPRIFFNFSGDREKITSIDQWGTIAWSSMEQAFAGTSNIVGNASDTPNLTGVTSMLGMFSNSSFNQNIGNWNTSTIIDMSYLFYRNADFNQDIGAWNTSIVTNMSHMFYQASSFNQDIGSWDVSFVTNMYRMFYEASNFNGNIGGWGASTGAVTNMHGMFYAAVDFNQDISSWNTSLVATMERMFHAALLFNQDIGGWDTSAVTNMSQMFNTAQSFSQDLGDWNVESVTDFTNMFNNVTLSIPNYDSILRGWGVQNLQSNMVFSGGNSKYCTGAPARANMIASDGWTITDSGQDCTGVFFTTTWKTDNQGTSNATSITIPTFPGSLYNYDVDWDNDGVFDDLGITGSITHDYGIAGTYIVNIQGDFPRIFFNNSGDKDKILSVDQWGTGVWESMEIAFQGASNLVINASDTPNLTMVNSIALIFADTSALNQDLSGWNTSSVTNMSYAFFGATGFNQDISTWDVSNVTTMAGMFAYAFAFNQDISAWDVSKVTDMSSMFFLASSFNQNLGWVNTGMVENMSQMFNSANVFNQDISGWNTTNVTNMESMFFHASSFNQDVGGWNTSSVTNMHSMFSNATAFDQDIGSWDVESVTMFINMFANVTLSETNYDALLIGWDTQNIQPNMVFSGGNSQYCTPAAITARANMIASDGWTITDGGQFSGTCTLGIDDLELENTISLYPNPSNNIFTINGLTEKSSVAIFNITGKKVLEIDNYENNTEIKTNDLTTGLYIVNIKNNTGNSSLKLIKE